MATYKLTKEIISAAITGFESQKTRIDLQIAELRALLGGDSTKPAATEEAPKGKRRKMSAAARKRIGEAQRKRWAASKSQPSSPVTAERSKPKRRLSAAGRAAIVAALRKRWAAKKAAATKAAPKKAVAKKVAKKAPLKTAKAAAKRPSRKTAKAPEAAITPEAQ